MQQENTFLRPEKKKKICQTNNHLTNIRSMSTTEPRQHITQVPKTTQVLNLQPTVKQLLMSQWFPQQQFPVFGAKKKKLIAFCGQNLEPGNSQVFLAARGQFGLQQPARGTATHAEMQFPMSRSVHAGAVCQQVSATGVWLLRASTMRRLALIVDLLNVATAQ